MKDEEIQCKLSIVTGMIEKLVKLSEGAYQGYKVSVLSTAFDDTDILNLMKHVFEVTEKIRPKQIEDKKGASKR